ncbi:pyridoxamine 5'-phosphate oxidase [Chitinasiproducens palmae]|uniref:Pyridoxine/pyridoxamine 5'-phosphate oxidase n=1 Tax=Chitinasiproducens palmae TaxID=1770053 RepID=A0A1H2PTR8_9BURK|nr:pyridoxamine 5'-phosphate oxidase [Chitinasiproducens palmae]SDV50137.1 Pyridoxamine 5'-phosphate oxidase [Chitinasiproducens palmae]
MDKLADLRRSYAQGVLLEADVQSDPIQQFEHWFADVLACELPDPNAMTLATASRDGRPSARIVLLKGIVDGGFRFFTNYDSRKGRDLAENPHASLSFYWVGLERQVRIEGTVAKTSAQDSDEYFFSRPVESRLGAWASEQSQPVADRAALEQREREFKARFGDDPPRPPHWGGYQLSPQTIEFWQGRPSRLHDRLVYSRNADGSWTLSRLSP